MRWVLSQPCDRVAALLLGHLRMNIDQAVDALLNVATAVFPTGSEEQPNPETNTNNLQVAVNDMIQGCNIASDIKMYDRHTRPPSSRCRV